MLLMSAAAGSAASVAANAEAAAQWKGDGQSLFLACEFKRSARVFEKALADQPDSADLHYWLGKSYARLAEVSSPLSAPKNARKARRNLEQAVRIDPRNNEYMQELFEFYVESPEWFGGGLERAAVLAGRISPGGFGADPRRSELAGSREDHSGAGWWMRWAILRMSGAIGHFVPEP
jgi:tetratricopeptide (TPR) repeat protein